MHNLQVAAECIRKLQTDSLEPFTDEEVLYVLSQMFHFYFEYYQKKTHKLTYQTTSTYQNVYMNRSITGAINIFEQMKQLYNFQAERTMSKDQLQMYQRSLKIIKEHKFKNNAMTSNQKQLFGAAYHFHNMIQNPDISFARDLYIQKYLDGSIELLNVFDPIKLGKHFKYNYKTYKNELQCTQYQIKNISHHISEAEAIQKIFSNADILNEDYVINYDNFLLTISL